MPGGRLDRLKQILLRIDGKAYKAYKEIKGRYQFKQFALSIDHVQGDPFAVPSRISVTVPPPVAAIPDDLRQTAIRRIAVEDFLCRQVATVIRHCAMQHRGSGHSGEIAVVSCGQQVLERNAVVVGKNGIEARLTVGLPASGRTVLGRQAVSMLCENLVTIVEQSLRYKDLDHDTLRAHVCCVDDQDFLRRWLEQEGLLAFIADGSLLPRRSGIDDRPLGDAVALQSPPSLRRTVHLPHAGPVNGLVLSQGVNLIVGGGFHGKSTVLNALEKGIYNHIPGDGRERVVTVPNAVKIRAEDGRKIHQVDISPFITHLPFGRSTARFSTDNASGSTSQAANIIEVLDHGCRLLLIDEDTSATNFMIRDQRMQALVSDDKEPITPLLFRVRELYESYGVSSIIVMGGSGDYFSVSDTVIMLDRYQVFDVTEQAKKLAADQTLSAKGREPFSAALHRKPPANLLDASRGRDDVKIDVKPREFLFYGRHPCDLSKWEQLADIAQTKAIGLMIHYYTRHYSASSDNLHSGLRRAFQDLDKQGLDIISPYKVGNLAKPRLLDVAAAINRLRERPR